MSRSEIAASPEPGTRTPVFVDDSGRRRARLRIVVRVVGAVLGLYFALALVSLVVPVSFPVAHLGNLGVLPRHRQNATLGPQSKEVALPAALQPSGAGAGNPDVPTATTIGASPSSEPGSTTPARGIGPPGQTTIPSAASTIPTSQTTTVTTTPSVASTTPPTTGRPTTSTAARGPSTTGAHGPPSTTPGKGSKP